MNIPMLDTAGEVNVRVGASNLHGAVSVTKNLFVTGSVQYKSRNSHTLFAGDSRNDVTSNRTNLKEFGLGYMSWFGKPGEDKIKYNISGGYGFGDIHYNRNVSRAYGYGTRYYYDMQASIRKLFAQISISVYLSEHVAFGGALRLNNLVFDRLRIKGDSLGGVAIQNPSEGDKEAANPDWSKLRKVTLTNADLAVFFRGNLFPFYGMVQLGYSHNFNYRSYSSAQFSRLWLEFSIGLHFGIFRRPGAGKQKEWLWE